MSRSLTRHWLIAAATGLIAGGIAYAATLQATPGLLMAAATKRVAGDTGFNAMSFPPLATDEARAIVRPSPDLAYSTCPFDLSRGPVLIDVAAAPAPYWSLSIYDEDTNVAFVRNNGQAGGRPIKVAILKPGGVAPAGYEPVAVPGTRGIALIRVLVPNRADFAALDAARRQSKCAVGGG